MIYTHPTVVMEIKAHQKPSQTPLVNMGGKLSEFLHFSWCGNKK